MNAKTKEETLDLFEHTINSRFRGRHQFGSYYREQGNLRAYRAAQKENADYIRDLIRWIRNEKTTTPPWSTPAL